MSTAKPLDPVQRYSLAEWEHIQQVLSRCGYCLLSVQEYSTPEQLSQQLLNWDILPSPYVFGQSPRHKLHPVVYTATEYPASEHIPLHHELSYAVQSPRYLALYCHHPATTGGQTPLLDGAAFLQNAPETMLRPFVDHGLLYHKCMPSQKGLGKTWMEHFETADQDVVEDVLLQNNATIHWHSDGALSIVMHRPAVRNHDVFNQMVWFAQPTLWHLSRLGSRGQFLQTRLPVDRLPIHVTYGDGTEISGATLMHLQQLMLQQSRFVHWRSGDLLIIDNWWVAHGRLPFTGERIHWAAMGSPPPS